MSPGCSSHDSLMWASGQCEMGSGLHVSGGKSCVPRMSMIMVDRNAVIPCIMPSRADSLH